MILKTDKHSLELVDESNYASNSIDHLFQYQQRYSSDQEYKPTTQIGIKVYEGESIISSAIVRSSGGASGVHSTSQIVTNNSITICCASSVFKLSIPKFSLEWMTKADGATCFQIFKYKEDFIIHGELNITRLMSNGEILWQNSGADIFTTDTGRDNFKLIKEVIQVTDWNDQVYFFDINGKLFN